MFVQDCIQSLVKSNHGCISGVYDQQFMVENNTLIATNITAITTALSRS